MDKIVVIGGGGYGKIVISILKKLKRYKVIGYTDLKNQGNILNIKYLGDDSILGNLYSNKNVRYAALGIGQLQNTKTKRKVVKLVESIGFQFPVLISPTAVVNEGVEIGKGSIIRDGAVISTGTKVGEFSIIGTSVNVSYDTIIGDYVNISLGSNVGINIKIGNDVLIGMASTVMNYKTIVSNCLIGAGSLVLKDCLESGVYYGRPAKKNK